MSKTRILVIGPLPPPYGGYAHVVSSVVRSPFTETFDLIPYDTKLRYQIQRGSIFPVIWRAARHITSFSRARLKTKPDAALLFTGLSGSFWRDLVLLRQCHRADIPVIVRFFGGDVHLRMARLPGLLRKVALEQLSKASAILVETIATIRDFQRLLPEAMIQRVPNFVHKEDLAIVSSDATSGSRDGVFFLGTMTPTKGVEIILASVDEVCDCRRIPFHFVGGEVEHGYLEHFRSLANQLRHRDAVIIHGQLTRADAHAIARRCNIFAFPPPWPEGQPAAMIEAMGMGLVPVASRWGGIPEIVQHRHNGLLLDNLLAGDLARSIKQLIADRDLLKTLSINAQETIRTQYEAAAALKQYRQIFARILRRDVPAGFATSLF